MCMEKADPFWMRSYISYSVALEESNDTVDCVASKETHPCISLWSVRRQTRTVQLMAH